MTTMVRESHSLGQCSLLGDLIDETCTRYVYRRRFGDTLALVDKRSPTIHVVPCKTCPDYSSSSADWLKFKPAVRREGRGVVAVMETKSMTKRGGPVGPRRGDRKRFPYEARFVGGRLVTPAELQKIHRYVIDTEVVVEISDERRAVVEVAWPELVHKLPPQK